MLVCKGFRGGMVLGYLLAELQRAVLTVRRREKALLSEKNEEAKSVIEDIYPRYLAF